MTVTGIDGKTKVYGILGNPVAHSFSPLIHNTLAEEMGINMVYVPLGVKNPKKIGDAVRGAAAMGIQGLNVTVPYKSEVIPFLTEIDPVAKAIGAVNTLVPAAAHQPESPILQSVSGYKGYNTDYLGLRRAIAEMGMDLSSMDVILIGAGGAARAAGFMCAEAGVRHLTILNRTEKRAQDLAWDILAALPRAPRTETGTVSEAASKDTDEETLQVGTGGLSPLESSMKIRTLTLDRAAESVRDGWNTRPVLAIQCTNVGLAPETDAVPVEDPEFYSGITAAYDCIYNPEETKFLTMVHGAGRIGRSGMDMLLFQGISAFTLWTGIEPDSELIEEVRSKLQAFIHGER